MHASTTGANKALVLEAFDTLFNKRDYQAAERYWSPAYIQHSAHIAPGREGLFDLIRSLPKTLFVRARPDPRGRRLRHGTWPLLRQRPPRGLGCGRHLRIADGALAEHWDVLQEEVIRMQSVSGLPMFGEKFPA